MDVGTLPPSATLCSFKRGKFSLVLHKSITDEFLDQVKPRLLGFFKGGRREFEQYVQGALGELLKKNDSEEEQPWKVE